MCRFLPLTLLARIIAANPAGFCGLTDWLSITPALGDASRPACWRAVITRTVDRDQQTAVAPRVEIARTVETGGKHLGNIRHAPPLDAIYRIAFITRRRQVLRGRPPLRPPAASARSTPTPFA
jgi:hypothetical protein